MTEEQKAAYVNAQTACALIEMEGMKALNLERDRRGHSLAYTEEDFLKVIEKYGIHHNAVMKAFHD
jgi:hypothetical protein